MSVRSYSEDRAGKEEAPERCPFERSILLRTRVVGERLETLKPGEEPEKA